MHSRSKDSRGRRFASLIVLAALLGLLLLSGCGEEPPVPAGGDTGAETQTATATPYQRRTLDFYKGLAEPRPEDWEDMARETDRILGDGFNAVALLPPALITERLGGRPRVIAEGQASLAEDSIDGFHEKGLAVYVVPTTRVAGFTEQVQPTPQTLEHLTNDAVRWAGKAELHQAELLAPLSRCNSVLGTDAARNWSGKVLPLMREKYSGPIAIEVVPDIQGPPADGQLHDFERLDYRGYDYLLVDIFPMGGIYDATAFEAYVKDILLHAAALAQRDGLKGFMIGELGAWREAAGVDTVDGPFLSPADQADMAQRVIQAAKPVSQGIFWYGWTLPGRGARDFPVEETLKSNWGDVP